jgi:DNA-binding transcriptional ArsR family regulator
VTGVAGDVYRAIGDPTRRAMLDILAERERPVEELVARFGVSFSAVSQHLSVLHEAGLVSRRAAGRRRLYRTVPGPLDDVHAWTARHLSRRTPAEPRARILRLAAQERERNPHPGVLRALRPTA